MTKVTFTRHDRTNLRQAEKFDRLPGSYETVRYFRSVYTELRAICVWPWKVVSVSVRYLFYRVFSLTWPASMQIYWNKRKRLHKKRVQLPKDPFGTPTWPPFHCFGTPIWPPWRHVKTLYKPMNEKMQTWLLRFPAKENPSMEKALFDWPIVLQYDVKAKYRLISRKFSGMKFFQPSVRSTNQNPLAFVSVGQTNQIALTISVHSFFLFCSNVFISSSYENRSNSSTSEFSYR